MDNDKILSLSIKMGRTLLENGAETYRVEETMLRVLSGLNPESSKDAFVTSTGLFASLGSHTRLMRIKRSSTNLNKISLVNNLSRKITGKEIGLDSALREIEEINSYSEYPLFIRALASALASSSFAYIFGGSPCDCVNSFISGLLLSFVLRFFDIHNVSAFITSFIGGGLAALFSFLLFFAGLGNNIDKSIIGALMLLVPGLSLTNALRDVLEEDYLSGGGRIFDAIMRGSALACGAGIVIKILSL